MKPYLIQRGTFRTIPDQEIAGLDSHLYPGAAVYQKRLPNEDPARAD